MSTDNCSTLKSLLRKALFKWAAAEESRIDWPTGEAMRREKMSPELTSEISLKGIGF